MKSKIGWAALGLTAVGCGVGVVSDYEQAQIAATQDELTVSDCLKQSGITDWRDGGLAALRSCAIEAGIASADGGTFAFAEHDGGFRFNHGNGGLPPMFGHTGSGRFSHHCDGGGVHGGFGGPELDGGHR